MSNMVHGDKNVSHHHNFFLHQIYVLCMHVFVYSLLYRNPAPWESVKYSISFHSHISINDPIFHQMKNISFIKNSIFWSIFSNWPLAHISIYTERTSGLVIIHYVTTLVICCTRYWRRWWPWSNIESLILLKPKGRKYTVYNIAYVNTLHIEMSEDKSTRNCI